MNKTKKSLLASGLSLLICAALLVGTTFAWFTDSVANKGNRIQAGTLDIDLLMDRNLDGTYDVISDGTGDLFSQATGNGILWEPGKTEIVYLAVRNNGSLALNYNILLNVEDAGLANALEYAVIDNAQAADLTEVENWAQLKQFAGVQTGRLTAGQIVAAPNGTLDEIAHTGQQNETDYFALAVHMDEQAGNEYANGSISIDICVMAKQAAAEQDAFGNTYDAGAEYDTGSAYIGSTRYASITEAIAAAQDGDTIQLSAGTFREALNLQGKSLTIQGAGKGLTVITGPETYSTQNIPQQTWAGWPDDATVYALISANKKVSIKDLTVSADPDQVAAVAEFRSSSSSAFVGIHIQSADAEIENVAIQNIKPTGVTGTDHHNFGLYITSAEGDANSYTVTYRNGIVSGVNRGGIYCWSNSYTLNFTDVTVIGPGSPEKPNGSLVPAEPVSEYIYAFAPFYLSGSNANTKHKNVTVRDAWRVEWGGADWNGWGARDWATQPPTGVTCINSGIVR